jgi:hypothetical protein
LGEVRHEEAAEADVEYWNHPEKVALLTEVKDAISNQLICDNLMAKFRN